MPIKARATWLLNVSLPQSALAKELCVTAIADNCYAPLVQKDVFELLFPPGLIRLELQLLLEDYLRKKAVQEVQKGNTHDLAIHMSAGGCGPIPQNGGGGMISPSKMSPPFLSPSQLLSSSVCAGSRDLFEQVLTEDISPPILGAKFESKLVTIPSQVLKEWCDIFPCDAKSTEKVNS